MNSIVREMTKSQRLMKSLGSEIFFARERWKTLVIKHAFAARSAVGDTARSRQKILYFVEPGEWWQEVKDEMQSLKTRLENTRLKGAKVPRSLWLPTVIEQAKIITLKIYLARSVRRVSHRRAMDYANATGRKSDRRLLECKIDPCTGRNYRLHVRDVNGGRYMPFTDWAVCICQNGSLPILKKRRLSTELRNVQQQPNVIAVPRA